MRALSLFLAFALAFAGCMSGPSESESHSTPGTESEQADPPSMNLDEQGNSEPNGTGAPTEGPTRGDPLGSIILEEPIEMHLVQGTGGECTGLNLARGSVSLIIPELDPETQAPWRVSSMDLETDMMNPQSGYSYTAVLSAGPTELDRDEARQIASLQVQDHDPTTFTVVIHLCVGTGVMATAWLDGTASMVAA